MCVAMKAVSTMRLMPTQAPASRVLLRLPGRTELSLDTGVDALRRLVLCGRVCAWALLITVFSDLLSRFTVFRSRSRAWGQVLPPSVCCLHELFGCLQQGRSSRFFFGAYLWLFCGSLKRLTGTGLDVHPGGCGDGNGERVRFAIDGV